MYKDIKVKSPNMPYKEMIAEILHISGIGRNSVISIISEYKKCGTVSSPNKTRNRKCLFDKIDELDRNALWQKIHYFWLKSEIPTIDKILQAVNDDPALPNFKRTVLYETIKKLDFVFTNSAVSFCEIRKNTNKQIEERRNFYVVIIERSTTRQVNDKTPAAPKSTSNKIAVHFLRY